MSDYYLTLHSSNTTSIVHNRPSSFDDFARMFLNEDPPCSPTFLTVTRSISMWYLPISPLFNIDTAMFNPGATAIFRTVFKRIVNVGVYGIAVFSGPSSGFDEAPPRLAHGDHALVQTFVNAVASVCGGSIVLPHIPAPARS